jgi:hypothetical protein
MLVNVYINPPRTTSSSVDFAHISKIGLDLIIAAKSPTKVYTGSITCSHLYTSVSRSKLLVKLNNYYVIPDFDLCSKVAGIIYLIINLKK